MSMKRRFTALFSGLLRSPALVGFGCLASMAVSYLFRFFYWPLFYALGTYPGDIWYIHMNYGGFLQEHLFFRVEYPIGIFILIKLATGLTLLFSKNLRYETFLATNAVILGAFGLGTAFLLWRIHHLMITWSAESEWRIWVFWVLAPSFIFYSLLNFDLPAVFLCLLAVYFHLKWKEDLSAVSLGLGTAVKFFPILLLPLFLFDKKIQDSVRYCVVAGVSWLLVNLPFMLFDFEAWLFPYVWQVTREPTKDGMPYLLYHVLGDTAASLFFPLLYALTLLYVRRHRTEGGTRMTMVDFSVPLLLSFLLANRIFSPQYILWVLPFFVFASPISFVSFYLFEVPNVAHTLFLFKYMADYPLLSLTLRAIRYLALFSIYLRTCSQTGKGVGRAPYH